MGCSGSKSNNLSNLNCLHYRNKPVLFETEEDLKAGRDEFKEQCDNLLNRIEGYKKGKEF